MGKITSTAILLMLCNLIASQTFSQLQRSVPDYLKQRFLQYVGQVPREELFIHSDREEYIAGEEVWFTIYLIDRQSFKPSLNSKIAYFELLNDNNRPVLQKRILIDHGFGPGQILLPDTLSTGTYIIRAYTNWMKNFLPDNCFTKDIVVYNTKGAETFKGKTESDSHSGQGTGNNRKGTTKNTGVRLQIDNSKPDTLEILVSADHAYRTENKDLFYIFIQTHGNINLVSTERIAEGTTRVSVPKTLLGKGINQVTLFNARGKPVGERYVYTPARDSPFTLHATDTCKPREPITLEILSGVPVSAASGLAGLSISVAPVSSDREIMNLNDYLVFGTEYDLSCRNLCKGRKISSIPAEEMDSILLHASSNWINWESILSSEMPVFRYPVENREHFLSGKWLGGDPQAARSGEVLLLSMPGREAFFQYARTDQEGSFSFRIPIDAERKDIILMPDETRENDRIIIESSFTDLNCPLDKTGIANHRPINPRASKWSVNFQVSRIYGISSLGNPLDPVVQPLMPVRFYGRPDFEVKMADYISLPVMEEVFFEILPHVSLKKKKSDFEITITDRVDNMLYEFTPCLMIDGVVIRDPALIAGLDPGIVEKIEVIKERYIVGEYVFPGIINVITRSGDFSCVSLPASMVRFPYRIADPVWSFTSPDYSTPEKKLSRIPDYRNTLYWNPAVRPDQDGKVSVECWSADNKSDYLINIQGITQAGEAISMKKIISVK